jgi:hypothetical protein
MTRLKLLVEVRVVRERSLIVADDFGCRKSVSLAISDISMTVPENPNSYFGTLRVEKNTNWQTKFRRDLPNNLYPPLVLRMRPMRHIEPGNVQTSQNQLPKNRWAFRSRAERRDDLRPALDDRLHELCSSNHPGESVIDVATITKKDTKNYLRAEDGKI